MRAGEILGDRYVLQRELGRGGMGVVWVARDRTNESRVAIKLLLDDGTSETNLAHEKFIKELRQRLRREAEACMKLADHPNVVRVLDFSIKDTEHHGPYIVMELLDGESLQDHLKRKRSLEPKVAARIAADVASCLTAAHAAKLIHRDLKPGNIYLHREPGMAEDEFITKVLDFGVCKDGDSVEIASDHTPTMTGMVLGSIAYMSPQQAMGSKNVDFRTDIWSVGVVLYELLTGLRAFSGGVNDVIAIYSPILIGKITTPVPAPSSRMRNIPPELDAVVERCTRPKPADRYASAEELARDLYAIAGLPMPVIPAAKASSSGRSTMRGRELVDLYEPAIIASKAVPDAHDDRRFNELATTIPLKRASDETVIEPVRAEKEEPQGKSPANALTFAGQGNVPDPNDVDATVRIPPKGALAPMPRPPAPNEPAANAEAHTQYLPPDAAIASPMLDLNEMHQALAEHRKSSLAIPIPDLGELGASGGTQLLKTAEASPLDRVEPSTTTSALMSQSLPETRSQPVASNSTGTTGRRRRRNRGWSVMIGGAIAAAFGLLLFVVVKQFTAPQPASEPKPVSTETAAAPTERTAPPQQPAPPEDAASAAPTRPAADVAKESPPAPTTSAADTPAAPSANRPPPTPTKPPAYQPAKQKCTGVGVFKRCK